MGDIFGRKPALPYNPMGTPYIPPEMLPSGNPIPPVNVGPAVPTTAAMPELARQDPRISHENVSDGVRQWQKILGGVGDVLAAFGGRPATFRPWYEQQRVKHLMTDYSGGEDTPRAVAERLKAGGYTDYANKYLSDLAGLEKAQEEARGERAKTGKTLAETNKITFETGNAVDDQYLGMLSRAKNDEQVRAANELWTRTGKKTSFELPQTLADAQIQIGQSLDLNRIDATRANNEADNAASMARTQLQQSGANYRTELTTGSAERRAALSASVDQAIANGKNNAADQRNIDNLVKDLIKEGLDVPPALGSMTSWASGGGNRGGGKPATSKPAAAPTKGKPMPTVSASKYPSLKSHIGSAVKQGGITYRVVP